MRRNKIVYIDLDDTSADFTNACQDARTGFVRTEKMHDEGFFSKLQPISGAKQAIHELLRMGFDVWFLTQPLAESSKSYIEKAEWVSLHFPHLHKKLILTQDKGLHVGEYLVDDNIKWKEPFERNGGKFIHFKYGNYNSVSNIDTSKLWLEIIQFFRNEDPII